MLLVDTDVLVWFMRGNDKAYDALDQIGPFAISVVTYMELVQGMRNKEELHSLRRFLKSWDVRLLYITEEISAKAMFYVEQHFLSHALQVADALIGATALSHGLPVFTGNDKYYKIIKDLQIRKFRP